MTGTIWTIGHSNRSIEDFLALLAQFKIQLVADVRRFPGSRRQPQYSQATLEATLREHGVAYRWFPQLGGRRRPLPDSRNLAWRNTSFRGYADHMQSPEFSDAQPCLNELLKISGHQRTTLMCAELLWWRCHRALVSDALRVQGIEVIHIHDATHTIVHPFTSPARVIEGRLTYVEWAHEHVSVKDV